LGTQNWEQKRSSATERIHIAFLSCKNITVLACKGNEANEANEANDLELAMVHVVKSSHLGHKCMIAKSISDFGTHGGLDLGNNSLSSW
jgi:hypothetical protein